MKIFAIDPGTTESAYVIWDGSYVLDRGVAGNYHLLECIGGSMWPGWDMRLAIEMIASYGMPVGAEVFETCVWIGRFIQSWTTRRGNWTKVYRLDVKLALCGSARAKDGNVRQALIDRFGGKDKAIGRKANPGPLYGISGDLWAALGVAVAVTLPTFARAEATS
jgi:hypothetical protein